MEVKGRTPLDYRHRQRKKKNLRSSRNDTQSLLGYCEDSLFSGIVKVEIFISSYDNFLNNFVEEPD